MVCRAGQGFDVYLVGDLRDCEGSVCVSLGIESGFVRAGTPDFEVLAFGEHIQWNAVCRGIDHAEVEVIGRVEEVNICVVVIQGDPHHG